MSKRNTNPAPEDRPWSEEVAKRYRLHYQATKADLEKIRQIRLGIRERNKRFKKYEEELDREYPLFPDDPSSPDES